MIRPIAVSDMPNPDIIRRLYARWQDRDLGHAVSSHWQRHGPKSEIHIEHDRITRLKGSAFGQLAQDSPRLHSIMTQAFDHLTIFSYLPFLSGKKQILSWLQSGRMLLKRIPEIRPSLSYDVFRQCCIAQILAPCIQHIHHPSILLIGDGFGILSALLKHRFPTSTIYLVDILPALFFQATVLGKCLPDAAHALCGGNTGHRNASMPDPPSDGDVIYCHADDLQVLDDKVFHLAINVASFQEMTPEIIAGYFAFLRDHMHRDGLLYCCNRRKKSLPGGETNIFVQYPWLDGDRHIIDGEPPFYRWYFSDAKTARALKIGKIPVPFGRLLDGPMQHRLTRMSKR